jgi:3',5'-cyclic AMP phosphodiesterase CpdA
MRRRDFLKAAGALGVTTLLGCDQPDGGLILPARDSASVAADLRLLARFAHVTDTHVMDEESPARFAGAHDVVRAAWRSYEAYSTQLYDGILRAVNRIHAAGRGVDFLLHTGDGCDNVQGNELAWFARLMDGGTLDPRSGPDDRPPGSRPPAELDPHALFSAQGLYRQGVHGDLATIPWYGLFGNHDVRAIGVFPIVTDLAGHRTAPLPLPWRPGTRLPLELDPTANFACGRVTPAAPGPPALFGPPVPVVANPARAYFDRDGLFSAVAQTDAPERGLRAATAGTTWYSVSPPPGLRLIGLDTTQPAVLIAGGIYSEGALSRIQLDYLRAELAAACAADEIVIVVTHHPSAELMSFAGTEVQPDELRDVLRSCPRVVLHLCGHNHRHRVTDRGGYLEIETCSTLDLPQEGRLLELWQGAAGQITIRYEVFSHLDDALPPLGEDPLRGLRLQAQALARGDKRALLRQQRRDPSGVDPAGRTEDRFGRVDVPTRA